MNHAVTRVVDDFLAMRGEHLPSLAVVSRMPIEGTLKVADELAEIAVNHGKVEADKLNQLIQHCRSAQDPARYIQQSIAIFADGLAHRGANKPTIASRKCDLKAILVCAAQHPDFVVEGAGIQGAAKAARGHGKPSQVPDPQDTPAEASSEPVGASVSLAMIAQLLQQAWAVAEQANMGLLADKINHVIRGL